MVKRRGGRGEGFPSSSRLSRFSSIKKLKRCHHPGSARDKMYECNQCAYKARFIYALVGHLKTLHANWTPFRCSVSGCNRSYAQRGHLKRHFRTHAADPTVQRAFPCPFDGCGYRAARKSNLEAHMQNRHNENRPRNFDCPTCYRAFYTKSHPDRHMTVIHANQKTDDCSHCKCRSSEACNLRKEHGTAGNVTRNKSGHQLSNSRLDRSKERDSCRNDDSVTIEHRLGVEETPSEMGLTTE